MVRLPVIHNKRFQNDEKVLMFFNKTMIRRVKEREINETIEDRQISGIMQIYFVSIEMYLLQIAII